jgi:hypothetical protein
VRRARRDIETSVLLRFLPVPALVRAFPARAKSQHKGRFGIPTRLVVG